MNVLLIEDNAGDARLIREQLAELHRPSYEIEWVQSCAEGRHVLSEQTFDIVLLDLFLPDASGIDTLIAFSPKDQTIPIIVLTGLDSEAVGVESIRRGAQDYLIKDSCSTEILKRAIEYAIQRDKLRRELTAAHTEISMLREMLPICSGCKKYRDDDGDWQQIEQYLDQRTDTKMTHTYCPQCEASLKREIDAMGGLE